MRFATYRTCGTWLAVLAGLVLAATGLWAAAEAEQPATRADKEYVTDPVTGKTVVAPQYGGTITQVLKHNVDRDPDPYSGGGGSLYITSGVLEKLGMVDWAIDRNTYPFLTGYHGALVRPDRGTRRALGAAGRNDLRVPRPARAFTGMTGRQ